MSSVGVMATERMLQRTHTAPVTYDNNYGLSQTMSHASRSAQLPDSTAYASSLITSLSSMTSSTTLAPNLGPVQATNNIINQRADASRSLYQICVNLRQRLALVPGFDTHLNDSDGEEDGEDMDPVSSLWRCLRKGTPFLTIYNVTEPSRLLQIDETMAANRKPKVAAFKFVQACLEEMKLPPGECFTLSDLFGDDTTGFVKVTQVINVVLDVAQSRGYLKDSAPESSDEPMTPGTKMSYRDHVVRELVDTERKYVQDLENLHELKKKIEQKGVIPGDVVHAIFLNINAILDFQRRFLIKIETTNEHPQDSQQWSLPFTNYEDAFNIYQPFIANQRKAAAIAKKEFDKISLADHPVVVDFNTLDGFLLKPMQRLVKYPLLLKDLRDKTNADDETKQELTSGIEASNRVLMQANAAVDRELRNEALEDLRNRVDDWKKHKVDHFGDLLLHGHFPVVTGKTEQQKDYTIYLFERILLCCTEVSKNKDKSIMGVPKEKKDKKDKKNKENKTGKLQLKGRIFMTNVTEVLSLGKQGSYTVQIFWKGDPGVENFIIRFSNEETMKKWYNGVDGQRKEHANSLQSASSPDAAPLKFHWMQDQTVAMPNPYQQDDDNGDYDEHSPGQGNMYHGQQDSAFPRNSSSTSLRSRSTTGESTQSLAGIARGAPPRFPMGLGMSSPPLSVQTQLPSGALPSPAAQRGGESYFSPVSESPASFGSRTSTHSSSMFPFPRQGTPQGSWEDSNRYTAPAIGRAPSRDSSTPSNQYQMNGRTAQRPSLPAMAPGSTQSLAQQRSRSYSTPDINAQPGQRRPGPPPSGPVPAVPGIPPHLHPAYDGGIPRSANGSPIAGLPIRTSTQSPGVQRERMAQQPQHVNAPQYNRSNTTQIPMSTGDSRVMAAPAINDMSLPTQLKVKVNCDGNYVTLVVAFNITYQSLIDRIDAKVGRFSNSAIARGTMRLRYLDEDADYITISSDEDVQVAFQEWREAQKLQYAAGQLGEIELFCQSISSERD
ncbi:hypothetical protein BJ878DRAFT_485325 [Calycina marina]|uniref:Uncharacterized protein n=1 Tax=Calycina marina TaxID=1763456 RepID=A0A9P7ZCC5_9HELO|nr:hypothetical protein BJ878DRAFT_485325 [Calycina marina]